MNRPAMKEALTDTAVGAAINFPLNVLFLWGANKVGLSIMTTGVVLSVVFTFVAIVRKYLLRSFFEKNSCQSTDK